MNSNKWYEGQDKKWGIQMCHTIEEMEDLLNYLQDEGQVIHEVNVKDLTVVYYEKVDKKRIDE